MTTATMAGCIAALVAARRLRLVVVNVVAAIVVAVFTHGGFARGGFGDFAGAGAVRVVVVRGVLITGGMREVGLHHPSSGNIAFSIPDTIRAGVVPQTNSPGTRVNIV